MLALHWLSGLLEVIRSRQYMTISLHKTGLYLGATVSVRTEQQLWQDTRNACKLKYRTYFICWTIQRWLSASRNLQPHPHRQCAGKGCTNVNFGTLGRWTVSYLQYCATSAGRQQITSTAFGIKVVITKRNSQRTNSNWVAGGTQVSTRLIMNYQHLLSHLSDKFDKLIWPNNSHTGPDTIIFQIIYKISWWT